jgi:DNA-binding transcriptional regulator YhcF (GntR family)
MRIAIDRNLPVSIRTQLRGIIEYGIVCGDLAPGEALPSVRELAETIGVAPMTVNQVYADLKAAKLIVSRPGSGTFVTNMPSERPEAAALRRRIDQLINASQAMGIRPAELVSLVGSHVFYRESTGPSVYVVMMGIFADATADYAHFIATHLGGDITVEPMTIADAESQPQLRARANSADLVITLANRHREVLALVPQAEVVAISFIPSERTRMALASIDPSSRVAVVSKEAHFLPTMKVGVERFASHVADIQGATLDTPELSDLLSRVDVVIYCTGSSAVKERVGAGIQVIEYRHMPNVVDIERSVTPIVRAAMAARLPAIKVTNEVKQYG